MRTAQPARAPAARSAANGPPQATDSPSSPDDSHGIQAHFSIRCSPARRASEIVRETPQIGESRHKPGDTIDPVYQHSA